MRTKLTNTTMYGLCLAIVLMLPTCSFGQAIYGSVYGTVTDSTGAAVTGAKVTVTSVQQGTKSEATTNETGNYSVSHLIPGSYSLRFEGKGFKSQETKAVQVFADTSIRVDSSFQVGQATETVEVTAAAPELKTDRADVATIFTEKAVEELPVFNRNFTEFQLLTPGTQKFGWTHASSENPQGSVQIFTNGQPFAGTSFSLDGTDNQDPILGIIVINPTLESVTETKITTQNFDAEFGQATAGVVTAQTKSGTNRFHGSLFEFRRSNVLQARNPFTQSKADPITGKFIPDTLWNQFGGSIGGPIKKDKLFFFADYQGTRRKTGNSTRVTVPTDLVRSTCLNASSAVCDLSEYLTANGAASQIYNPSTGAADGTGRTAFFGNVIPKSALSPQAISVLSAMPAPNTGGAGTISDNYTAGGTGGFDDNAVNTRVDWQKSQNLHIFGRYSLARFNLSGPTIFGPLGGFGFGEGGFAGLSTTRNHSVAGGFDYAFSPTLLTDFRFGFYRYHVNVDPNGVGSTPATDAGIPGLNLGDDFTSGQPSYFVGDKDKIPQTGALSNFGFGLGVNRCNCPLRENEKEMQFVNNWTRISGNHAYKFGADIRYATNLRVPSDRHRAGELTFAQGATGLGNGTGGFTGGVGLATFLLGDVTKFTRFVSTSTDAQEQQKRWFFYGQDTWRVNNKLTMNYGLRWEIYFPQTVNGKGQGGWLNLETGNIQVAGYGDIKTNGNVRNSFGNLAPRFGLSYEVNPKTVVRVGYGRSFSIGVFGSIFGHSVTQNLPVLAAQEDNAANSTASVFNLATGPAAAVFPAVPSDGVFPLPDNVYTRANPVRQQLPTLDAWNISVQRQITPSMSVDIAYVGNKGSHVFAGSGPTYNANQASIVGFASGVSQNDRKPYFGTYGWTQGIDYFGNSASSNYNALQAKLQKSFSGGYQFLAHYTWSKAFNYDSDYYAIDPSVNYGRADFNRDHDFVFTNLVELPFGKGKKFLGGANRVTDYIIGGWQINSITNWGSGLPFTPSYNNCNADKDTGPCRPDIIGSFSMGASSYDPVKNQVTYFTPVNLASNSSWAEPAVGTFGNVKRNTLNGPGFFNTDLSVFKNFSINERFKGQFRTEIFNVFNHVNLAQPNGCIDCSSGGLITGTAANTMQRTLQFGLKFNF